MFSCSGISVWWLLLVAGVIWASSIISGVKNKGLVSLVLFATIFSTLTANATILDKNTFQSEYKTIKPNQTAFLVPMQGANATTQKQFDSGLYMGLAAVATKRINIPHTVLPKSDTWNNSVSADQYVPSACLYIVGREPYSRLWCKESTRGTTKNDEGTYLESRDSINIDFGTTISAHVDPTNAALYL